MKSTNESKGLWEIFTASLLFGLLPIVVRLGENLGPYNLSFFRVLVASISIVIYVLFTKKRIAPLRAEKSRVLVMGILHGFIILGYFFAIQLLSVASAVLLIYSSSIWIVVFSHFMLKEKVTKKTLISLAFAFIGLFLILPLDTFFLAESFIGSISGLLAGVGMGFVYTLSKTIKTYDKVSLTFWQNLIAIPFLAPLVFLDVPKFSVSDTAIVLIIGTALTAVPFILIYKGFQKVKAHKGSILIMLDIVFAITFAWLIFEEVPSLLSVLGALLIILGSYFSTKS